MQKKEQEISKRTRVGATPWPHNTYINDVVEEVRRAAAWGQADHRRLHQLRDNLDTYFILYVHVWNYVNAKN